MANFKKRLEKLERKFDAGGAICLWMADGSVRFISKQRLFAAMVDICQHNVTDDVTLVARSLADDGPQRGCGHWAGVIRVLAAAQCGAGVGQHRLDACEGMEGPKYLEVEATKN